MVLGYFYVFFCNNFVIFISKLIVVIFFLIVGFRFDNSFGLFDKRRESGFGNKICIINMFSLGFV